MPSNVFYGAISHLKRKTRTNRGGLCNVYYIPVEYVTHIPLPDISTATIATGIIQVDGDAPGWYKAFAPYKKGYRAQSSRDDSGPIVDVTVNAFVPGDTTENDVTLDRLKFHKYIVVVERPRGPQRVIGTLENPAEISFIIDSGNIPSDFGGVQVTFTWRNNNLPLVYENQVFPIAP